MIAPPINPNKKPRIKPFSLNENKPKTAEHPAVMALNVILEMELSLKSLIRDEKKFNN